MPNAIQNTINVYQNPRESNNLLIDFARNSRDFMLNQYTQVVKVDTNFGSFTRITNEVCSRLSENKPCAPESNESYNTVRRCFSLPGSDNSSAAESWFPVYEKILGTLAMNARAAVVAEELTKASNFEASHVIDVANNYGAWNSSTTSTCHLKSALWDAKELILRDTRKHVCIEDLRFIISPETAAKLMRSQEILDYLKREPAVWKKKQNSNKTTPYGFPETLYGIKVVVEDRVQINNSQDGNRTPSWVWPNGIAVICARPGGIIAQQGLNYSTCVVFANEEMTAETVGDQLNRRLYYCVTENYCAKVVAPVSGVLLRNLFVED